MTRLSRFANYSFIRSDILVEHLEEADFLLGLRQRALASPDFDLPALAKLERRLDAHLDGLALGGERTRHELAAGLTADDPWRVAAMAAGMLAMDDRGASAQVLDLVPEDAAHPSPGVAVALRYLPLQPEVQQKLVSWLEDKAPGRLALAWRILGSHGVAIAADPATAADHDDPAVRAAVAEALGYGQTPRMDLLARLWRDEDLEVRHQAALSRARIGDPDLLTNLRETIGATEQPPSWEIELLACLGDRSDVDLLVRMVAEAPPDAPHAEAAIDGLATLGLAEAVPALLTAMEGAVPLATAAGQAFVRITGLELPALPETEVSPEEEDETFEDLRPRPDPVRCRELWAELADAWASETRWRQGKELDSASWLAQPADGDLLTRREEITRLRYYEPAAWSTLELDARADRQQGWTSKEPS